MAVDPLHFDANNPPPTDANSQLAADLIRDKVNRAYAAEPNAQQELAEDMVVGPKPSRHQRFIHELRTSGKDLAAIQTEWHAYYVNLPETDKQQVWREFYASQAAVTGRQAAANSPEGLAEHKHAVLKTAHRAHARAGAAKPKLRDARSTHEVQAAIRDKVTAGGQLKAKHHLQSLLFGLGMGCLFLFIFMFGFFNEVFIAPFIQPSRVSAATPIIIGTSGIAPTKTPEVIIPKINLEIPVNYSENSTDENAIENDLQSGVVHYPTTVRPGQIGNAAFFGHSSNNIFNPGKYKFAFVLLHTLVNGDTFYLTYHDKVYVYKVISHKIVSPNDVGVLNAVRGQKATATLITCDPPGTSLHRLVVVGQQVTPDPAGNTKASATVVNQSPTVLPGNGPTLWTRFIGSTGGKVVVVAIVLIGLGFVLRWINLPRRFA
ncbi:MAG TPA: sortase [Candidatus Saccharimonadales bacterium]|nr:sortase [Candidatus Saccharimonadales bacterium]